MTKCERNFPEMDHIAMSCVSCCSDTVPTTRDYLGSTIHSIMDSWLDRAKMRQILRKAFRHLRVALFKILNRCRDAVKVLRSEMDGLQNNRVVNVGFGVSHQTMCSILMQEDGSTLTEWAQSGSHLEEEDSLHLQDGKIKHDEDVQPSVDEEIMELDGLKQFSGNEVDLYDWLEWDSEESSDEDGSNNYDDVDKELFTFCPTVTSQDSDQDDSDVDWSEEEDEEGSEEDAQLWESFLHSDDPYNPFRFSSLPVRQKPKDWQEEPEESVITEPQWVSGQDFSKPPRKVRFSDAVDVYMLVDWPDASRSARDGSCWQEMARDRARFSHRVLAASEIISPCLLVQHRERVWQRLQGMV